MSRMTKNKAQQAQLRKAIEYDTHRAWWERHAARLEGALPSGWKKVSSRVSLDEFAQEWRVALVVGRIGHDLVLIRDRADVEHLKQ